MSDKVTNDLLKRISDLEFEIERLNKELEEKNTQIRKLEYIKENRDNLLEGKDKEIERLNNTLKDIKDYVNFLVIYNQTINGKFSKTQWCQDILGLIGSENDE